MIVIIYAGFTSFLTKYDDTALLYTKSDKV
jgi:hypothetical protein